MDETTQLIRDLRASRLTPIGKVKETPLILPNYSGIRGRKNPIITVASTAPTSPTTGDLWVDTS